MNALRRFVAANAVLLVAVGVLASCGDTPKGPNDADRVFVGAMVPHHMLGIELIDDAVPRVDDVRLRRLVFKMSAYHDSELHDLEKRAKDWGVVSPQQFPGWIDPAKIDAMSRLSGTDYDVRWLDLMIEHHEGAVTLADVEASEGANDDLRSLARRIAEAQRDEIAKMRELRGSLVAG